MKEETKAFWRCEECGYESRTKPMPKDRNAFYKKAHEKGYPQCPKCKSEAFVPVGY